MLNTPIETDGPLLVPDTKHSKRGPSSSERWMNCVGSCNLIEKLEVQFGKRDAGADADEGTAAHTVLAHCLASNNEAWMYAGRTVKVGDREFIVDDEMVEGVQLALDWVRDLQKEYPNAIVYSERELRSVLDPEAWGAGDVTVEVPSVAIFVADFKFGQGVAVEPTSPQPKQYGYYAYEMRGEHMRGDNEPQKIICVIIQPRIPHPKGPIRSHTYDVQEVEDWFVAEVLPALEATRDPTALLKVGDWCKFCPGKKMNKCPALQNEVMTFTAASDPKALTSDELGDYIAKLEVLVSLLPGAEKEAFDRMCAGESVKNRKLVHKKANRIFRESIEEIDTETGETIIITKEEALITHFGTAAYDEPSLKTPPNIEKLPGGKEFVSRWCYKPDAGLTSAPMSDKRPAVRPLMERFDEVVGAAGPAGVPV